MAASRLLLVRCSILQAIVRTDDLSQALLAKLQCLLAYIRPLHSLRIGRRHLRWARASRGAAGP